MLDAVGKVSGAVIVVWGVQIMPPFAVVILKIVITVVVVGDDCAGRHRRGHNAQQHKAGQQQAEGLSKSFHVPRSFAFLPAGKQKWGR